MSDHEWPAARQTCKDEISNAVLWTTPEPPDVQSPMSNYRDLSTEVAESAGSRPTTDA